MTYAEKIIDQNKRVRLRQEIERAEKLTTGEIRVFLDDQCKLDILDRTAFLFDQLNMQENNQRNGILIYLSLRDHRFAIIGDAGINAVLDGDYWLQMKDKMTPFFISDQIEEGIVFAIREVASKLKHHFPNSKNDNSDLSDKIVFGKEGND